MIGLEEENHMATFAHQGRLRHPLRVLFELPGRSLAAGVLFLGFSLLSGTAQALGLGPLKVESTLGNPLRASAPVQLGGGESAEDLEATLATPGDYELVGKPRSPVVDILDVHLVGDGTPRIRIVSKAPLQDPLFEVMVRVGDGGNQILKMYTVALDPPQAAPPRARSTEPRPELMEASRQAPQAPPTRVRVQELPASVGEGPGNANAERAAGPEAGPTKERPKVRATEGWAKRDRYGPVRAGDTLTTITRRIRQDPSLPMESALVALWKANRDAFIDGNMNLLRKGAVLEVPAESRVRRVDPGDAKGLIRDQRKKWIARGRPQVKTSPGHQRYQLKVTLRDSGDASPGGKTPTKKPVRKASASASEKKESGTEGGAGDPAKATGGAGGAGAGKEAGMAEDDPGKAVVAELESRIGELRQSIQSLRDQRTDAEASSQALEKRLAGLSQKLKEQRGVIQEQSAALERLAKRPAGSAPVPARDRYILWGLAGLNLLLLVAVVALWGRLRRVQAVALGQGPGAKGGGSGAGSLDDSVTDALTRANAQAAAGELKQARSTLWDALAGAPRNWAAYGRLLDLYEQEDDGDQFEEVTRRLFEQLGAQQPEWQEEIRARGRRLKPESPLFAGMDSNGAAAAQAPPTLDFEGLDLEPSGEAGAGSGAPVGEPAPEEFSLDFDVGGGGEGSESGGPSPGMGSSPGEGEPVLSFDSGDDGLAMAESGMAEPPGEELAPDNAEGGNPEEDELAFPNEGPVEEEVLGAAEGTGSGGWGDQGEKEEDELVLGDFGAQRAPEPQQSEDGSLPAGKDAADDEDELVLDLGESAKESGAAEDAGGAGKDIEDFGEFASLDWEDNLEEPGKVGPGAPEAESLGAAGGGTEAEGSEDDLSLDLMDWGDGSVGDPTDSGGSVTDFELREGNAGIGAAGSPEAAGEAGQNEDEFEIKLDLAQAWIDMGDQESAKGLLQEVGARGAPPQKERAQQIMASLS